MAGPGQPLPLLNGSGARRVPPHREMRTVTEPASSSTVAPRSRRQRHGRKRLEKHGQGCAAGSVQSSSSSPTPKCSAAHRMPNSTSRVTHSRATTTIRTTAADMATPRDGQRPISAWNVCATLFRQRELTVGITLNETSVNRGRDCRAPDAGPVAISFRRNTEQQHAFRNAEVGGQVR
jgi:hypothetical protein